MKRALLALAHHQLLPCHWQVKPPNMNRMPRTMCPPKLESEFFSKDICEPRI